MPRPYTLSVTPDTPDPDGLADNNDSSGSSVTLDGALTSGGTYTSVDGLGHRLDIIDTATVDQSGATFTVTGTNANGEAVTEAITGPGSGATVESTEYFKTVTSITIASAAACGTVDIGTVDEVATPTYVVNWRSAIELGFSVEITGTIDYDVQHTLDNILNDGTASTTYLDHSAVAAQTASADGNYDFGITGMRVITNSYTGGATIKLNIVQGY
jgi:hypothetical protein